MNRWSTWALLDHPSGSDDEQKDRARLLKQELVTSLPARLSRDENQTQKTDNNESRFSLLNHSFSESSVFTSFSSSYSPSSVNSRSASAASIISLSESISRMGERSQFGKICLSLFHSSALKRLTSLDGVKQHNAVVTPDTPTNTPQVDFPPTGLVPLLNTDRNTDPGHVRPKSFWIALCDEGEEKAKVGAVEENAVELSRENWTLSDDSTVSKNLIYDTDFVDYGLELHSFGGVGNILRDLHLTKAKDETSHS